MIIRRRIIIFIKKTLRRLLSVSQSFNLSRLGHVVSEKLLYLDFLDLYYNAYRHYPNLKNPKDLNEKLLWLSYYWRNPLKAECADKYKCREYATSKCGLNEDILVPILGVWNKAEDINFDNLPNSFVLKCNHGCGYNIIVKDKKELNINKTIQKLNGWLSENFAGNISEIHYKDIKPHLIICEKFLPAIGNDSSVIDYKLMCFNGVPCFIFVAYNRDCFGEATFCTFSLDWEQLYYIKNEIKTNIPKPSSLNKMIEYAKILSKNFPFVRVDFYEIEGRPLLGELTFTPYGNILTYFTPEVIIKYGNILKLPPQYHQARH